MSGVYDDFAELYNRYWGEAFTEDAQEGISQFFLPLLEPGASILDLCCGAGHMAAWLCACGFEVTGLDVSEAMLAFARENAPAAKLVRADARDFTFERPFQAVVSTFDSVNHLDAAEDVAATFASVSRALQPQGLFLFDINTDRGFRYAADETWAAVRDDHVCVSKSRYDPPSGKAVSEVTVFQQKGGDWDRADLQIREYLHPPETILTALEANGFAEPDVFDAEVDFGMPRAEGRLFYLARLASRP